METQGSADKSPGKKSDLKLRVLSAIVLGPAVLVVAWIGGLPFVALALVTAMLFLREWLDMSGTKVNSPPAYAGYITLAFIAALSHLAYPAYALGFSLLGALCVYGLSCWTIAGRWAAEGLVYSGLSLWALLAIRSGEAGRDFLFFLLIVVWTTDIAAYFAGRALGGPKLWPRVSPKKTWSGALGGFGAAVVLGSAAAAATGYQPLAVVGLLAGALSIASQLGDLLESGIKRRFDVKDSSHLIPGHGGIMDRIDGLVAAAIAAVLLGMAFGGRLSDPISGLGLSGV
jgi:phosphatidate cytidylyltransferase